MLSKIFTICMAIYYLIYPYVSPSTQSPIKALHEDNIKLTFVALADTQVSNYLLQREPVMHGISEDLCNSSINFDALVVAGDVSENGLEYEYEVVENYLRNTPVKNFIMATGNHDIRLRDYSQVVNRFTGFANRLNAYKNSDLEIDSLHYLYEINDYTFIVLGSDKQMFEEAYISDSQLSWLDSSLEAATADGKPVFVVVHQAIKDTHGLPDTWSPYRFNGGSVGKQSDEIKAILNKYENVILLSGHMHTGFGEFTYEKIENFHSINMPSACANNGNGTYNNAGIGYVAEVYEDEVVFRARDFDDGYFLPDFDISISIE